MSKIKYPSIPDASTDPRSMQVSIQALKESVELLTGQRGLPPVTWDDLVRLGVIQQADVPRGTPR